MPNGNSGGVNATDPTRSRHAGATSPFQGEEFGCYTPAMTKKSALLILCARIGYNPP